MAETRESMLIDEIKKKYEGSWVAVKVTERDEAGQPLRGIVVYEDTSRHRLRDRIPEGEDVCIFFAGSVPREGYGVIL